MARTHGSVIRGIPHREKRWRMKGSLDDVLGKVRDFPSTILLPMEIDTEDIKDRIHPEPSQV